MTFTPNSTGAPISAASSDLLAVHHRRAVDHAAVEVGIQSRVVA
jgi:hypothetical protein